MDLILIPIEQPDSNKLEEAYELVEDFDYSFRGTQLSVPKFFQYDGASIPSAVWQLIGTPFNPRFMKAAIVHDWLFHTHEITRAEADINFYEMLLESGVNVVRATLMREAVENFGRLYWFNDHDDLDYLERLRKRLVDDRRDPRAYGIVPELLAGQKEAVE